MKDHQVLFVACTLFLLAIIQGCGSSDSPSNKEPVSSSTQENDVKTTATNETMETAPEISEPPTESVDPQEEVKAVFEKLLAIRTEPDPDEWMKADKQFTAFGKTAIPTLIAELGNADLSARELASMYLASLGPEVKEAAPVLEKALDDESAFIKVNAASTLTHFPEYQNKAIPVLMTLAKHEDPNTRLTAIYAIGNLESHSEEQLNAIQDALTDSDTEVQLAAIKILGQIGDPAKATLNQIQSLIDNSNTSEVLREAALSSKSLIEKAKQ